MVIRSHGVPKEIYRIIEERGLTCVDANLSVCKKIHDIVERESREENRSLSLEMIFIRK